MTRVTSQQVSIYDIGKKFFGARVKTADFTNLSCNALKRL